MYVIAKKEFLQLFTGVKSLIIIALLLITSYYSAKFSTLLVSGIDLTAKETEDIHVFGLLVLVVLFGQLFIMGLSHDSLNRELHERTMRFLVSRTSRTSIVIGKFIGIFSFWFVCITVSHIIILIFSHRFDLFIFSQMMSLLAYQIALTLFISILIPKPALTMFLGVILGLLFPALSFWLTLTSNDWFSWMKFFNPYYYLNREDLTFLVILLLAGMLVGFTHLLFRKREC
ncbi:ABC transporter permease subunit [Rossellomorea sp. YZS02]|uniref:ABC transporter permease subunit n=1 Tax=Rossellomorea sp. YZS02 TaxID=3097358 RepID=UPI002A0F589C|nr:ABC transporter permease subunit [Rossellomorea sp. YZS02]MDX8342352.1 ABC transporter permease subunit [Rossellomorea sp. YZS02]